MKSIYSYLNIFSFFNDLLESKMKTIEPIDRIIFDNKIKLIVFRENKEFWYKLWPLNIKKIIKRLNPVVLIVIVASLFKTPKVMEIRIKVKRKISGANE